MGLLGSVFGRRETCPSCGQRSVARGAGSRWEATAGGRRCRDCGHAVSEAAPSDAGKGRPAQAGGQPEPQYTIDNSIHLAAEQGDVERVRGFLDRGESACSPDPVGLHPMHYAANRAHLGVMALLLERGGDVDARGDQGLSPLHGAAYHGRVDAIEWLVHRGADPNARTPGGATPLAIARMKGQGAAAEALVRLGGTE